VGATAIIGCGRGQGSDPGGLTGSATSAATVDTGTAGRITGTVVLDGPAPTPNRVDMSSEPACAKANPSDTGSREVLTGENGALANVVVFVKAGLGSYRFDPSAEPAMLDQKGCMYEPRVVALMTNQPLEIRNDDATIHNVHATPKVNSEWNKAQRADSAPLRVAFPSPELGIPFMCNVHPWMRAFVFVFANPYYAVTTTAGTFELKNVPPGTYTIEAWHEKFAAQEQSVTLGSRASQVVSFRFKSRNAPGD
jgi:hypothetical protein